MGIYETVPDNESKKNYKVESKEGEDKELVESVKDALKEGKQELQEKDEAGEEGKELKDLDGNYSEVEKLRESYEKAEKEMADSASEADEIRKKMGFPESSEQMRGQGELEKKKEHLGKKIEKAKNMEKKFLEVPEDEFMIGKEEEAESGNKSPSEDKVQEYKKEIEEIESQIEKESRELREEFFEKWMNDSIEDMYEWFSELLNEGDNGEKAKKIIALKIEKRLMSKKEEYLESGDTDLLAFTLTVHKKKYDIPKKGERKFITGVEIGDWDGVSEKDRNRPKW